MKYRILRKNERGYFNGNPRYDLQKKYFGFIWITIEFGFYPNEELAKAALREYLEDFAPIERKVIEYFEL